MKQNGRLIILTGPSCVGKSPLKQALIKLYPELWQSLQPLVFYCSRAPRPSEVDGVDYHFRSREQIKELEQNKDFAVLEVRGDLQALDLKELASWLAQGDVFFEGNPFVGRLLQTHAQFANIEKLGIFMSPLGREEIVFLQSPERNVSLPELLTDIMRRKLLRRTRRQKGELSLPDLENIETRAASAYQEMHFAHHFEYVIVNHDGEDSDNWESFYCPLGDARKSLKAFVLLLKGESPPGIEHWPTTLLA